MGKKIFFGAAFLCLYLMLGWNAGYTQTVTNIGLQRHQIANSGCAALFPKAPTGIESGLDVDSNKVFTARAETIINKETYVYSVQVIQLRNPDAVEDDYEQLTQYLDYIKSTLNIADEEGYKKVNGLVRGKLAKAISDSWSDHTGLDMKVMGWIQGRTMAVLYVMGKGPLPAQLSINQFLNGFQFPATF